METRELGRTGLQVSVICLGTMTWGEQNSESEGHAQMDMALERGVNFFDTAEIYAVPPKRESAGRTEEIIGSWLEERKCRDKVTLATKVAGRSGMDWLRADGSKAVVSPQQIFEAVEGSLRRLRTDYIDLYQVHWPDRPLQLFGGLEYKHTEGDAIPIGETLEALGKLVTQGKVRHIGVSNETAWGAMTYLQQSEAKGLPRIASNQNAYNLVNRAFEVEQSEIAHREHVGLLAYSPLAQGYLTGKYEDGAEPAGARRTLFGRMGRYESKTGLAAISAYVKLAQTHGLDPAQMAIQFVNTRPFLTSNIIGATTLEQLETNLDSVNVELSSELLDEIEAIHGTYTNPSP
jgi:aryl-alcohol dehydrogenase-like predicted oxidoreductase